MLSPLYAALVRPLDEDWRASIDRIARVHRWPTTAEPAQLGALVRALSDAYNAPTPPPLPQHSDTAKILVIVGLAAGAVVGVALGLGGGKSSTVSPE